MARWDFESIDERDVAVVMMLLPHIPVATFFRATTVAAYAGADAGAGCAVAADAVAADAVAAGA